MISSKPRLALVICFWGLIIAWYVSSRVRGRREAKEAQIEREVLAERLLRPDWQYYEQHLQRPVPEALRELFADRSLVTSGGLKITKNNGISSFNPLDQDGLIDTADLLGFDIIPFATSDFGDAIFLRPGKNVSDTVYIAYHDDPGKGLVVLAESVAAMLEQVRKANDAT